MPQNDFRDHGLANGIPLRNRSLGFAVSPGLANCGDILGSELGGRVPLAARGSAFAGHVGGIISRRTEEQMGGIDASAKIASVAHAGTFGDWPVVHLITEAVGTDMLPIDFSIPIPLDLALPDPALIGIAFRGVAPEPLFGGRLMR